jgi:GNAT superfamily N-acetyltransferase
MAIDIRPVTQAEAKEYLRVLPYVNGFPQEEPEPSAWYAGGAAWPLQVPKTADELERDAQDLLTDWFRPQAAFVDGKIAGASAIVSVQVTVPGGHQVALGGVTSTAVLPTYRRRGLLRKIMSAMLDDCRERGEFLAGLSASEATIYGRYGFSPATFQHRWEVRRTDVAFRSEFADPVGCPLTGAGRRITSCIATRPGRWTVPRSSGCRGHRTRSRPAYCRSRRSRR